MIISRLLELRPICKSLSGGNFIIFLYNNNNKIILFACDAHKVKQTENIKIWKETNYHRYTEKYKNIGLFAFYERKRHEDMFIIFMTEEKKVLSGWIQHSTTSEQFFIHKTTIPC